MNLATKKFKMPFESGDVILRKVGSFSYKQTHDKFYILNVDDYLARGEVMEVALKNTYLVATKQSRDMTRYPTEYVDYTKLEAPEPPEIFGTFLGRIIPFVGLVPSQTMQETSLPELVATGRQWADSFFEPFVNFWLEVLPGPHKVFENQNLKPMWALMNQDDMKILWKSTYKDLLEDGLPRTPAYEDSIRSLLEVAQFAKSSQCPSLPR